MIKTGRLRLSSVRSPNVTAKRRSPQQFPCVVGAIARLRDGRFNICKLFLNEIHPRRDLDQQRWSRKRARLRLARAMLSIANEDSRDVDVLKRAALEYMALDYRKRS
jgi:hypothetical protein